MNEKKNPQTNTDDLIAIRKQKLEKIQQLGIDPYGSKFETDISPQQLKENFKNDKNLKIAGRILNIRDMGKSQFFVIGDIHGEIQGYLNQKQIPENLWKAWKLIDRGDWIGIEGKTFTTKKGEPTIEVQKFTFLSKSLRPLPEKWHGLANQEQKYRHRYLDLISNRESSNRFIMRTNIITEIRNFFNEKNFLEVETPMLHDTAGGAAARPFLTHYNTLDIPLSLRIASELYLKRLLVGGYTKIFEINRNFRNEGISRWHNPEFTGLEAYEAFSDFKAMANLVENLICHLAKKFTGSLQIPFGEKGEIIDLCQAWRKESYHHLVAKAAGDNWFNLSKKEKQDRCKDLGVEISQEMEEYEITQQVFQKLVEGTLINPCFVTDLPKELIPLAKTNKENPQLIEVFELIIGGQEISPGYSELNDPQIQKERFSEQAGEETQDFDEGFLEALEYGMPPAGGIGIGIDRLVMLLTNANNIRDVILFPQLKPKKR